VSRYGHCIIVEQDCKAPAGIRTAAGVGEMPRERVAVCAGCDEDVCVNCSRRVNLYGQRRRYCFNCIEDSKK
jgi:hypothetical protein